MEKSKHVSLSLDDGFADVDVTKDEPTDHALWVPYFKPNLTISMVNMFEAQNANRLAPNMAAALQFADEDTYLPLIHLNDFWVLKVMLSHC